MNDYDYQNSAGAYDFGGATMYDGGAEHVDSIDNMGNRHFTRATEVDFEDDKISSLPKILLMGPRRGGKTSIQVSGIVVVILEKVNVVSSLKVLILFILYYFSSASCISKNVTPRDSVSTGSHAKLGTIGCGSHLSLSIYHLGFPW